MGGGEPKQPLQAETQRGSFCEACAAQTKQTLFDCWSETTEMKCIESGNGHSGAALNRQKEWCGIRPEDGICVFQRFASDVWFKRKLEHRYI